MDLRAAMALSGLVAGRYVDRRQAPPNNLGSTIGSMGLILDASRIDALIADPPSVCR
jgi:hypothetical protein